MRFHRTRHQWLKQSFRVLLSMYLGAVAITTFRISLWSPTASSSHQRKLHVAPISMPVERAVKGSAPWTIFYNIYIAPESSAAEVLATVEEQVGQIRASAIISSRPRDTSVFLYYVTIGDDQIVTQSTMSSICGTDGLLQCIHLKHYSAGFEEVTLTEVHAHCQQSDLDSSVIYMHNKGSHHNRGGTNIRWRQRMTEAVSTNECLTSLHSNSPSTTCDVCGLLFQTIPSMHFPGNFWAARCDHVKKLLEPKQFRKELKTATTAILKQVNTTLTAGLYSLSEAWATGDDRYAMEQWIASHPDIQPCDLSATPDLRYWTYDDQAQSSDFEWALAPRRVLRDKHWQIKPRPDKSTILTQGKTDMFLLPGQLQKWFMIYGKHPNPKSSWVYSHFPEGDYWRGNVLAQEQ